MTRKLKQSKRTKAQSRRFIEKAEEITEDDADKLFERAFRKIVPPAAPKRGKKESPE